MSRAGVALIFAGGLGARMADARPETPKPLVRVGGVALLEIQVGRILAAGIRDIRIAVRHRAPEVMEAVGAFGGVPRGVVSFVVEEEPLGTAGALYRLKDVDGPVLTANGDLLSAIDYRAMMDAHAASGADLTIAAHDEHRRLALGEVVSAPDGRVLRYDEKPVKTYRISSGVYLIGPAIAAHVGSSGWMPFPTLVARAIDAGLKVVEYFHTEPWIDVNDAADLATADAMLRGDPVAFGVDPAKVAAG